MPGSKLTAPPTGQTQSWHWKAVTAIKNTIKVLRTEKRRSIYPSTNTSDQKEMRHNEKNYFKSIFKRFILISVSHLCLKLCVLKGESRHNTQLTQINM